MSARQANRRADLARIHCLAKELSLSRDEYESICFTITRSRSAGDLDHAGRAEFIHHLAARVGHMQNEWIQRAAPDRRPLLAKIVKLLNGRGLNYANGIARRMFQVDRIEFCTPEHLRKIIAALAIDAKRKRKPA